MKKIFVLLFLGFFAVPLFAGNLVMMKVENPSHLRQLFQQQDVTIHYFNDQFVIATADRFDAATMTLLDSDAFAGTDHYDIIYCAEKEQGDYLSRVSNQGKTLYQSDHFLIMKPLSSNLMPAKNDGMVAVFNHQARLAAETNDFPVIEEEDADVRSMMNQVSIDNLTETVQHLQDYGTRRFSTPQSVQAQNWLAEQYENLGLEVSLHDFKPGNYQQSSDNVIAVQRGTLYPDEYVVCGSHFDSYTFAGGQEPGADDNATGCAAVLETARILSQYLFERSIIYCSFSAEEIGLYGSAAFARQCAWEGVNILGYFNNDMNGYLLSGTPIHIDLIYPSSANSIGDYYQNICHVYFPEMEVNHEQFMSGDSDHTSFNNNGYVGLYPFEDHQNYSPYIHTANDLIGPSVNDWNLSQRYTEVNLCCLATLATLSSGNCPKVGNLAVSVNNQQVVLTWNAALTKDVSYEIYRDETLLETTVNTTFTETLPAGDVLHYCVRALYGDCVSADACIEEVLSLSVPEMSVENAFEVAQQVALRLSVSDVPGAKSYSVFNDNGSLQTTIYPFFQSVFLTNNIQLGQEYCFRAKAVGIINGEAVESDFSNRACGASEILCPIPQNFTGQYQDDKVSLIWQNVAYAESFNVYRNDVLIGENVTSMYYVDHQPPQGQNCYAVRTVCYNGESEPTEPLCYEVVNNDEYQQEINIYPNPADHQLAIMGESIKSVVVCNSLGQFVETLLSDGTSPLMINTVNYASGWYVLRIELEDQTLVMKRVVIQHE